MSKIDIFFVIAATVVIWRLLSRRTVAVGSCPHGQFLPQPKNQLFGTQITFWRRTTGLNRCCNNNRNDWRNADGGRDDREHAGDRVCRAAIPSGTSTITVQNRGRIAVRRLPRHAGWRESRRTSPSKTICRCRAPLKTQGKVCPFLPSSAVRSTPTCLDRGCTCCSQSCHRQTGRSSGNPSEFLPPFCR